MGFNKQSERRRAENQVVFERHNERLRLQIEQILPNEEKATFPVGFTCECSDEACSELIFLTIVQFTRYTANSRHFVIRPGHEQADIERVVESAGDCIIVEKFEEPPATNGMLNLTTANGANAQ